MISLKKITIFELPKLVKISYEGDEDLLNKYHVDKFSLEDAVESTMGMIEETNGAVKMQFFKVLLFNLEIGYLAIFENFLYSFGINIKFRAKNILMQYWDLIKKELGDSFITMLYPNNERAINWVKKQGMIEVDEVEEGLITLLYNKK